MVEPTAGRRARCAPSPLVGEGRGEGGLRKKLRRPTPHPARFARHPLPQGEKVAEVAAPSHITVLGRRGYCDTPSTAYRRNFAYFSPVFWAFLYSAEL